ncbi:V-set domain-containing T-cell activation inhibitor 1-like isoform X1 [Girardinichthys multiradiatus]|uniref:V-set domain-containing T-cell activation inhibitor 1-like isoform X1 n=1 Tax=Girardinichthys multiradiatus TaxID=208333 RepID=UPI001FABCA58|nr:V-set domain-containing T-cell activation inhibitor 1-like isoform X1 [Girardinichthys multiradiatus]
MIRLRDVLSSWLTVWGFISVLEARGLPKVVGPFKPVTAEEKKDVVLQCRLEPPLDVTRLTVEWKLQEKWVHLYRSQKDDLSFQDQKFKGRTSLFHKEMVHGNISLKLTEITKEDAGNYTCRVPKLVGQVKEGTVVLSVVTGASLLGFVSAGFAHLGNHIFSHPFWQTSSSSVRLDGEHQFASLATCSQFDSGHREDGPENVFSIMSTSTNNIITGSALTLLAVVGYVLRTLLCRQLYRRVFRFGGGLEEAL